MVAFNLIYTLNLLARVNSMNSNYLFHSRDLYFQLLNRWYSSGFLIKIMRIINKINTDDIITYKNKASQNLKDSLRIFLNFDLNYINLSSDIYTNFKALNSNFSSKINEITKARG